MIDTVTSHLKYLIKRTDDFFFVRTASFKGKEDFRYHSRYCFVLVYSIVLLHRTNTPIDLFLANQFVQSFQNIL